MNAKEYLEQIRELEHKIYCMKLRSEYYDKMSLSIPGPTYGEKIGSNPNRNTEAPFMKWLIKKDEIERLFIQPQDKVAKAVYYEYQDVLRKNNSVDFDDLL